MAAVLYSIAVPHEHCCHCWERLRPTAREVDYLYLIPDGLQTTDGDRERYLRGGSDSLGDASRFR